MGDIPLDQIFPSEGGGIMGGVKPPLVFAGGLLLPPHLGTNASGFALTANRIYYVPFRIEHVQAFLGAKFANTGTGDSGKNVKIAFYDEKADGGPGNLLVSCGASALTGAAAIRTLAAGYTPSERAWIYGALCSDSNPTLLSMACAAVISNAGIPISHPTAGVLSGYAAEVLTASYNVFDAFIGSYVDDSYASFPAATAVTPTNSLYGRESFAPAFGLYR